MKWQFTAMLLLFVAIASIAVATKAPQRKRQKPWAKASPLTKREQPMYFRLIEAFPDHIVLAQVAFSALLDSKSPAIRNTFDRKVADFVVCSKGFTVLAVIELDDSTHDGRELQDAARAALLTEAGYRVLRYRTVPDASKLQADLAEVPPEDGKIEPTFLRNVS